VLEVSDTGEIDLPDLRVSDGSFAENCFSFSPTFRLGFQPAPYDLGTVSTVSRSSTKADAHAKPLKTGSSCRHDMALNPNLKVGENERCFVDRMKRLGVVTGCGE